MDYLNVFKKAERWIEEYTLNANGIAVTSRNIIPYPEVTGYYIPTLLTWGYREKAINYAKWLCSIQKEDGSWYSSDNAAPYVFDSAQILKGLVSIQDLYPESKNSLLRGCDWILSNIQDNGRLTTPTQDAWGDGTVCSELIHLYCLSPLVRVSEKYGVQKYKEAAKKVLEYYKKNCMDEILNFNILSHFYAYIMEALVDLGEIEIAQTAMKRIEKLQKKNGAIPAYKNVNWVCSTGIFQFALVWYKLGELEKGNKAFAYACKLQNKTGGWNGSYTNHTLLKYFGKKYKATYFPRAEISWAVKYFLDALHYKLKLEFERLAPIFSEVIDKSDGRYKLVLKNILDKNSHTICDVGCGKGRYLRNLLQDAEQCKYHAVDLSEQVMKNIDSRVDRRQGTLVNIPYENEKFDFVYTVEALEHAVQIENAIKELLRVTKKNGTIIIIDKEKSNLGKLKIDEWEQWIDTDEIERIVSSFGCSIEIIRKIPYENRKDDLFWAWVINK